MTAFKRVQAVAMAVIGAFPPLSSEMNEWQVFPACDENRTACLRPFADLTLIACFDELLPC
jgi:hypothetical protein